MFELITAFSKLYPNWFSLVSYISCHINSQQILDCSHVTLFSTITFFKYSVRLSTDW